MALTTYSELKTAVADWLDRDDLTTLIPDFITIAEKRIFRRLRHPDLESYATGSIAAGALTLAVPADYIRTVSMLAEHGTRWWSLSQGTIQQVLDLTSEYETPIYARDRTDFKFRERDAPFDAHLVYIARPTVISDANPTPWVITEAPDLILYGALVEAGQYLDMEESRMKLYQAKYTEAFNDIHFEAEDMDYSGSALTIQAL